MRGLRAAALAAVFGIMTVLPGCDSSDVKDAIDEGQELIDGGPERKPIDVSRLGMNAFANDARFGSARAQFSEVRSTLGINHVRILFNWDNNVQPDPSSAINFSFYDSLVQALPAGVDALVVLTGVPDWMRDSGNWIEGNPRATFAERYVRRVVDRYGSNGRVIGWQIWNEPNMESNPDNHTLDIVARPVNYVEMLARSHSIAKSIAPGKLVINAATTAINQNFSGTLDYNKAMAEAGIESFTDRYAIHYYGRQFENLVRPDGVADFLNERATRIWVTESGAQGVNNQLAYGEQVWPYLLEKVPAIERIYVYQFTEATPSESTYGLRNLSGDFPVSDLYIHLRAR